MNSALRLTSVICCLTSLVTSVSNTNVHATTAAAIPSPPPGIITTLGGTFTSGPSLTRSMNGPTTISGSRVLVNRYSGGIWSIDPVALTATVIAGDGTFSYGGDGGPATQAGISPTGAVGVDGLGRIYIADEGNNRIRRIDTNGFISTVAGTGISGNTGDGGPATAATLSCPGAVAVLANGTFFINDACNNVIRKVSASGTITRYAGMPTACCVSSGDGGNALLASLAADLSSLTADAAGNLYFISDGGSRVRTITASTQIISTVAGTGTAGSGPDPGPALTTQINATSIAIGPTGVLFIGQADKIRQVSGGTISLVRLGRADTLSAGAGGLFYFTDTTGFIYRYASGTTATTTIAGNGQYRSSPDGGQVLASEFGAGKSMVLLGDGSLVFAEYGNDRVRKISPTGIVSTLAGGGLTPPTSGVVATQADVCPRGVARDSFGTIFFVDDCSSSVYAIDAGGHLQRVAGNGNFGLDSGDGGPATSAMLNSPHGFAIDSAGNLYVDTFAAVRKIGTNGVIERYAGTGIIGSSGNGGSAKFAEISVDAELAIDPQGDLYLADRYSNTIRRVTPDGKIDSYAGGGVAGGGPGPTNGDGGPAISAVLDNPENIVVDSVGNLYITERNGKRIRRVFRTSGSIETIAGDGSQGQSGDGGPAIAANFDDPYGIAIDPRGTVYVDDSNTGRLRVIGGPSWDGSYVALPPSRILDTRDGIGAPKAPVGQGGSIDLTVLGVGGVPSTGVTGVIMNVTATNSTNSSFVTVWPTGDARPTASSLNFSATETIPNTVTARVGTGGRVSLFNSQGSVDLIADVVGYFTSADSGLGARQISLAPSRILDTRAPIGVPFIGKVQAGSSINVKVLGVGGVPQNSGVSAVILNVTATEPDTPSFVTAWPAGESRPGTSSLNFTVGQTIPNQVIAKVGANGSISLYNNSGSVHLVADVVGYFTQVGDPVGAVVSLFTPKRILDTRLGIGAPVVAPLGQAGTIDLQVAGVGGVPSSGVSAVVLNLTATNPTLPSFATVWPSGTTRPVASSLNFGAGETIPNQVIAKLGANGAISLFNSAGTVDLIADVVGYYQ